MALIYSPGPAHYDLPSTLGTKPAVTIKGRHDDKTHTNLHTPGKL